MAFRHSFLILNPSLTWAYFISLFVLLLISVTMDIPIGRTESKVPVGYRLEFGTLGGKDSHDGNAPAVSIFHEQVLVLTTTYSNDFKRRHSKTSTKMALSRRELRRLLENPKYQELKSMFLDLLKIKEKDLWNFLKGEDEDDDSTAPISLSSWTSWRKSTVADRALDFAPDYSSDKDKRVFGCKMNLMNHEKQERDDETGKNIPSLLHQLLTFHPLSAQRNSKGKWERQIRGRGTRSVLYVDQESDAGLFVKKCHRSKDFKSFYHSEHPQFTHKLSQYFGTPAKRIQKLSFDPDHQGVTKTAMLESYSVLRAELEGVVSGPVLRGGKGIDFIDSENRPWDVKTPPSLDDGKLKMEEVYNSITKKLRTPYWNDQLKKFQNISILLDTSFLDQEDERILKNGLRKILTREELGRVKEVCSPIPLFF